MAWAQPFKCAISESSAVEEVESNIFFTVHHHGALVDPF
jgi:hypothetical protein